MVKNCYMVNNITVRILTAYCYIHSRKKSLPSSLIISTVGFNFTAVITFLGSWLTSAVNFCERGKMTLVKLELTVCTVPAK